MLNIFLMLKNDSLLPMIQVYLAGHKQIKVFVQNDIANFETDISFLEDLILITDDDFYEVIKSMTATNITKKYIFTSKNPESTETEKYFKKSDWQIICDEILNGAENKETEEYSDIPFHLLKNVNSPNCDIYIEITKNGTPHRIKLFNKNESIDQLMVEKYIDKGLRYSKVLSTDKFNFLGSISNQQYLQILDNDAPDIVGKALDTSLILLKEIGFNSTSTQLIEGVVESINSKLHTTKNNELNEIKNLLNSKSSRYYKKAHLISLLGGKILEKQSWATHRHQDLLTFNAIMSDICLEKEEMLYITSTKTFKESTLTQEEKDRVWTHARDAFHMIQAYKDRFLESDLLILEHHGNKSGVGFSEGLNPQLSKITIIFRICEDFAVELLKLKDLNHEIKLLDILQHLYIIHDKKSLHLYIDELKRCFID